MPSLAKAALALSGVPKRAAGISQHSPLRALIDAAGPDFTEVPGSPEVARSLAFSGSPESLEVRKTTPREFLDDLTGDPEQSSRVIERIAERNATTGTHGTRVMASPDFFDGMLDQPVTEIAATDDIIGGLDDPGGTWSPAYRTVAYPRSGDPSLDEGYVEGTINAADHEKVHSILHPESAGDTAGDRALMDFNVAWANQGDPLRSADIGDFLKDDDQFNAYLMNNRELSNLLFHTKRLMERLDGVDYGATRRSGNELGKKIMKHEPNWIDDPTSPDGGYFVDPEDADGNVLHGLEGMIDAIQQLYRESGEWGKTHIRDMFYRVGMDDGMLVDDPLNGLVERGSA